MHLKNEKPTLAAPATDIADHHAALAVGHLLADMNHEIRTSMNGILGMLELLRDTGLTASQQEYAAIAQNSVDTLLELIERIVDMSLIESNQFALAQAPLDLLHEMQQACINKITAARDKDLQLDVNYPPAVLLKGDPLRLRQLIAGLIDSAIRLSERGRITVNTEAKCEQPGWCRLRVSVLTTGLSEAGAQLASVLNQPIQSGVATLRLHGKTTLELVLCAQLARLMGGRIGVDSLPQQGTTFWFSVELPLVASPLAGVRVQLVAEQTADWSKLLAPLGALGLRVDTFCSAAEALTALAQASAQQNPYRIAMLGRQIQGMDGELLGKAIKTDPEYKSMLLAILDDSTDGNVTHFAQAGFSARIAGSASPQSLLSTLTRLCTALTGSQTLPFLNTDTATAPLQQQNEASQLLIGRRILVADDNLVNQQVAVRMLEKLGCTADIASNGLEAVDRHGAACYDLVLMDCEMPQLDGYQATERIRAMEGTSRHTPIVALTACTTQAEREKCLASGMDDFLSKPIRPQLLKETLSRWLPPAAEIVAKPATSDPAAENCGDELEAVRDMFGADFPELAALYQADSPPRIAILHQALAAGDSIRMAKVAHAFSGSSASIGATGLSALCKELEVRAKTGTLDDFDKRLAAVEAEYRRVSGKLQAMLS